MKKQTNSSLLAMVSGLSFFALTMGAVSTVSASPAMATPAQAEQKTAEKTDGEKVEVSSIHGTVSEIITAAGYTYVAIDVDGKKVWAAGPVSTFEVGDKVGFSMEMPTANFQSRSLKRTFDRIYFVDGFITEGGASTVDNASKMNLSHGSNSTPHGKTEKSSGKITVEIAKVAGGKDIAEIYKDKKALDGQAVKVRGEVTKYTPQILGFNWIHIRDNSTDTDLTITTSETAAVGDVIVVKGLIALEKDFGYGYVYPVILEKAEIVKE
ncbi:MAG: GW dipeptide domain-containing protein [Thiomicrorhabdus sp.]|nr:GW dipeptide domain-containing protein [Thiomicrorhabdus sp.]